MWGTLLRLVGRRVVHKAVAHQAQRQGIDFKLGFALFRDKRVPFGAKLMAIVLGLAGMVLLNIIELPVEALVAIFLPLLPLVGLFNGVENVIGPVLLSALFLTVTAPKPVVALIRRERYDMEHGVIDVESYPVDPVAKVIA
jgi:hypothetical protein